MRCPRCDGYMRREPARVARLLCGRFAVVTDADLAAQVLQRQIDYERRPRSVETQAPFNSCEYLAPRRLRAAVQTGPRLRVGAQTA